MKVSFAASLLAIFPFESRAQVEQASFDLVGCDDAFDVFVVEPFECEPVDVPLPLE
jgi:hypothetical protein